MFKTRFISILALLCLTVSGAWAQEVTLLTTIESTADDNLGFTSGSKTFDNIATVTFSGTVYNDGDDWGWYSEPECTLTVTAAEGYTITRVKFYNDSGSAFDEEAPFEAILVHTDSHITKVNGNSIGQFGVNKIEVYGYAGTPASTYTVTLKEGTEDATSWTIAPAEATTTGVAAGTTVTATYSGTKKVKSVKAKKKAATALAAAIAPALMDGATVVIEYNCDGFVTYFTFTNNGGTYSCNITGDESDVYSASLTKQGNTLVFVAQHSELTDYFDSTINFDTTSDTYSFAKKAGEFWNFKISVNGTDITDKLSETAPSFTEVTTFSELQTALSAGKNVKLMNDIVCTAEIEITSDGALTIDGNGKKLSTTSEIRAFKVRLSATVAFKDLTLTGFVSGGGPAINNSGTIVLDGCTISNCHVNNSNGGGAIENLSSGKLYAINTTFSGNYSGEIGGAINNYRGSLYMSGCTFTDNYTTNSNARYGGAIGINGGSEVRLINCSFSGNKYGTNTGTNDIGVYSKPTNYTIAGCTGAAIASNEDITTKASGTATLDYSDLSNISFTYNAE